MSYLNEQGLWTGTKNGVTFDNFSSKAAADNYEGVGAGAGSEGIGGEAWETPDDPMFMGSAFAAGGDGQAGTPAATGTPFPEFGNYAAGRPAWLEEEFRRPQETWNAFMSTQAPFWQRRAPLEDLGARLRGRYLLAAPYMAEQPGTPVSFTEYLRGYPGAATAGGAAPGYYASQAQLADRARAAAASASMAPGAYLSQFTPETDEWNRAAWMAAQFNPLDNESQAMQNQLRVANTLALQRGQGQNPMTGMMAAAIRAAMARVQQQRLNQGAAQGSFLNWYMGQTQPGT